MKKKLVKDKRVCYYGDVKVDAFCSDEKILMEMGERLRAERIRSGVTQAKLAEESGVAKSTVERMEKGESVQFLNLIKILRALNRVSYLDLLLPSKEKTPMEYVNSPAEADRKRVRISEKHKEYTFKWGDEE